MDPFQINAAYRQQQLLDEASARGLARTARGTGSRSLAGLLAALRSRIGRGSGHRGTLGYTPPSGVGL